MGKHLYRTQKIARSSRVVSILACVVFTLVACAGVQTRVISPDSPGVWRDYAWGVDERSNGANILVPRKYHAAGYCITSEDQAKIARWAIDPPDNKGEGMVIVHYVSLKDSGGNYRSLAAAACARTEYAPAESIRDTFLVTDIEEITSFGALVIRDSRGFILER